MRAHGPLVASALVAATLLVHPSQALAQGWPPPQQPQPTQPPTAQPAPTVQQPPPTQPGLSAGGLAPPGPINTDANRPPGYTSYTETQLQKSEREDSGRGLEWVYFNLEGGLQVLGLRTFSDSGLTYGNVKTTGVGPMVGAAAGLRLMFFTFGARARMGFFDAYNLTTINGEVGLHIPLGDLEPYFTVGGGYAMASSLDARGDWGTDKATIRGYDIRAGAGLDYYVTPVFSIGGNLSGEVLGLSRKGATVVQGAALSAEQRAKAQADGSAVGSSMTLSAVLALHF